jgi:hypothetical protein
MNRYDTEVASMQADLKEASELQEKNEHLDKYISEIPQLLAKHGHNIDVKKQMIEGLGISAYMYPSDNRTHKYVDWALLSSAHPKLDPKLALCRLRQVTRPAP